MENPPETENMMGEQDPIQMDTSPLDEECRPVQESGISVNEEESIDLPAVGFFDPLAPSTSYSNYEPDFEQSTKVVPSAMENPPETENLMQEQAAIEMDTSPLDEECRPIQESGIYVNEEESIDLPAVCFFDPLAPSTSYLNYEPDGAWGGEEVSTRTSFAETDRSALRAHEPIFVEEEAPVNLPTDYLDDLSAPSTSNVKSRSSKMPYECPSCDDSFPSESRLSVHMRSHRDEKPYKCNICDECFTTNRKLTVHMKIHTGEMPKPQKCPSCDKSFPSNNHLTAHMWNHHRGKKLFKCNICKECFTSNDALTDHLTTHISEMPMSHKCPFCSDSSPSEDCLRGHMRTHSGEMPYKCDICNECFTSNDALTDHLKTHEIPISHKCPSCSASFPSDCRLTVHMRFHSGENPFRCPTCGKNCNSLSQFTSHMRTHTGEKPYKCQSCGKMYATQKGLKDHMMSHTG